MKEEKKFLPYGKQFISKEDIQAVSLALEAEWLTRGPQVEEFETSVAAYCGATFAVAFPNGSLALQAACHAAEAGPFDRCITTPNTFVATAGCAMSKGATPVFVDIDPATGNVDLEQVGNSLEVRSTRGKNIVIPVHFSGISVDMKKLERLIKDPSTVVIEDAAHAIGSHHPDGSKVGSCSYSQMTVFSFHPVKTMTTGEGGMVTTNSEELNHKLRRFRNNGIEREARYLKNQAAAPWYYEVQEVTSNYNFTDIQAALGISQLKRLDEMVKKRRGLVKEYRKHLHNISGITLFDDKYDDFTAFHLFVVQIDFAQFGTTRTAVMNQLMEERIGSQLHYIPLYRHPIFAKGKEDLSPYFPGMEAYFQQALSLPLFYEMNTSDVERVVRTLRKILQC